MTHLTPEEQLTLIKKHTPWVKARAREMAKDYDQRQDYIQAGLIGLWKAALKFDKDQGNQFSTYATRWVITNIKREMALMSYPIKQTDRIFWIGSMVEKLERECRWVSDDFAYEVLKKTHPREINSAKQIHHIRRIRRARFQRIGVEGEKGAPLDLIADTDIEEEYARLEFLHGIIDKLPVENWKTVLRLRLEGKTLVEIAEVLQLSMQRIHQIEKKAEKALRKIYQKGTE